MTVQLGEFENRGFLNGPLCPIYGCGVILVIVLLTPIQENLLILYIGSVLLCTGLELGVGVGMEKLFHNIWWDYSMEKFNFHGYICLKISLLWGLACLAMMRVVQPVVMRLIHLVPPKFGNIFLLVCFSLLAFDFVISLCIVKNFNSRLKQLDDISRKMRFPSENIGSNIAEDVLELKAKYDKLLEKKVYAQERLLRAFPSMKSRKYASALGILRNKIIPRKRE